MQISFSTLGCPEWTLGQIARNAQRWGYEGVELRTHSDGNHFSPEASSAEARRVGRLFRDADAPVMSVLGYSRFAFTDNAEVERNQELLRKLLGHAESMGAKYVRTFIGAIPKDSSVEAITETAALALRPLVKEAAKRKLTIAIETHDDWCGTARMLNLLKRIECKRGVGLVYDIYNCILAEIEPWPMTYRKLKPHIAYCHLKDGYHDAGGQKHYVFLGAGELPLRRMMRRFKHDGYKSYFSFEWEKKWHPDLEAPERVFPQFAHKLRAVWQGV